MITTAGDALLADIIARPDDDAPRLIFADWLEDNGEPERAEFIRVQIAEARRNGDAGFSPAGNIRWLRNDEERAKAGRHLALVCPEIPASWWASLGRGDASPLSACAFRRGFLHKVRCSLKFWRDRGAAVAAGHPIGRAELTDRKPAHRGGAFCWWAFQQDMPSTSAHDDIGHDIWVCLEDNSMSISPAHDYGWKGYATEAMAIDALSAALIRWARRS